MSLNFQNFILVFGNKFLIQMLKAPVAKESDAFIIVKAVLFTY